MISGSGAHMQSASYLPAYYHVIDQNVGGSGSLWQVHSSGTTCKIGMVYNVFPESSDSDPCSAYNKEILKQTMLNHEAVFRNQVHELHRLYGRQRELMNEISRNHWQMRIPQPNLIPSQMPCSIFQKALDTHCPPSISPGDGRPPAQGGENFQMPSTFAPQKSTQAGSGIFVKETALEEQRVSTSKSHYSGKRLLDLELPAEEYIDSEDEEGLEDRNSVQVPQVQYDHSQSTSTSPTKINLKVSEASSSNGSSNCSKTTFLFNLNEPLQLDESETPNSANFIGSSMDIIPQDQDSFGKPKSESPVQNEESIYHVLEGKGIDGSSKFLDLKMDSPLKLVPCSSEAGNEGSSSISGLQDSSAGGSPLVCDDRTSLGSEVAKKENQTFDDNSQGMLHSCITNLCSPVLISSGPKTEASTSVSSQQTSVCNFREVPFAIQALPCFNNPDLLNKTSRSSTSNSGIKRKYCNSKENPAHSPSLSCCITGYSDNELDAEHSSLAECIENSNHAKSTEDMVIHVMPQSCLLNIVVSQEKLRTDETSSSRNSERHFNRLRVKPDFNGTNMEAPVSSDKKEHPLGESEENEMPSYMPKQKTGDPNEDFDRIAAEAIVSMSSLEVQQYSNDKVSPLEIYSDCLNWFANIVSSVTSDQEIERLLNDASSSDHNLLFRGEIGFVETTSMKLTGMNLEDCCPETSNKKSKTISGMMMLSPSQEEKGRARKTRQKKGSLSCIALSSFNLIENLQETEQLIAAVGSTSGKIMGERCFGRNGRGRRSSNLKMVSSNEIERRVCSLLKQHTPENELCFIGRSLLGWGRKNRRQKNRRAGANYCLHFN